MGKKSKRERSFSASSNYYRTIFAMEAKEVVYRREICNALDHVGSWNEWESCSRRSPVCAENKYPMGMTEYEAQNISPFVHIKVRRKIVPRRASYDTPKRLVRDSLKLRLPVPESNDDIEGGPY